jgi:hypothetical protein
MIDANKNIAIAKIVFASTLPPSLLPEKIIL